MSDNGAEITESALDAGCTGAQSSSSSFAPGRP